MEQSGECGGCGPCGTEGKLIGQIEVGGRTEEGRIDVRSNYERNKNVQFSLVNVIREKLFLHSVLLTVDNGLFFVHLLVLSLYVSTFSSS